ncbi:MAG: hypothetical protein KDD11_04360 [Acidobacteria bacterium]|nr:hypothetical protein [Acidobacteriota bacterium]
MQTATQLPEPGRFWIRYSPRAWPGPEGLWTHLGRGGLGVSRGGGPLPAASEDDAPALDDVLYLPPAGRLARGGRDALIARHAARGTPVLVQILVPEPAPAVRKAVFDPLPVLLDGDLEALSKVPAGAVVVWPLIAGLTDGDEVVDEGLSRLAEAGVSVLQALTLQLSPGERRRLAEGAEDEAFHALFHRPPPSERAFARRAYQGHGFAPFVSRPLPTEPLRGASNREVAGLLARAGDLCLRLAQPQGRSQGYFRAARWIDATEYDVAALAREGNLGVVGHVDDASRELVEEWLETGASSLVDELTTEYLTGPFEETEP